jgi:hypothetical protein
VLIEGVTAFARGLDERTRLAGNKRLFNLHVSRTFKLGKVRSEVAVCKVQNLPQMYEIDLLAAFKGDKRRHYLQPNRLMYNIIKFSHSYFQNIRMYNPVPKIATPPVNAIQRQ